MFVDDDRANFPLQAVDLQIGHTKFDRYRLETATEPPMGAADIPLIFALLALAPLCGRVPTSVDHHHDFAALNVAQHVFPAGAGKDMQGLEPADLDEILAFIGV